MRELYDALAEKPEWLTAEAIDRYAAQMAAPYQVAAYHHFENGFDDKLDYQTLEEAEAAAQGYVAGTMEEDGFAYDGAAVYDAETRQCLRVYGDYPDEKAQEQAAAFALEHDTAQQNTAELPAFLDMHLIEANLLDDGGRKHKRQEIFEYFQAHKSLAERTEFLKNSYNDIWVEVLTDGVRTGYHAEKDGLKMWEGSYLSRTSESVFSWSVITEMTEGLIERGEYKIKLGLQNAPIVAEQLALFDMGGDAPVYEAPADAPSGILAPARTVPQEVIDLALCTGGNEPNSAERYFTAQPNFLRQCKMFITQDEIDHYFLREGVESRLTIYSHFCYPHSTEERQKFIKGSFGEYSGGARAGYQHTKTSKGLEYERDYNSRKYDTIRLTIPNVVKEYERLIAQKRFPGEDAIAKIPEYERGQLARTVYNGFYNAPDDVPRPYPKGADYYDALPMIEEQLQDKGKTAEILAALTSRLDGTDESDRFYDSVRHARERLSEYVDGTFSLFNHCLLYTSDAADE